MASKGTGFLPAFAASALQKNEHQIIHRSIGAVLDWAENKSVTLRLRPLLEHLIKQLALHAPEPVADDLSAWAKQEYKRRFPHCRKSRASYGGACDECRTSKSKCDHDDSGQRKTEILRTSAIHTDIGVVQCVRCKHRGLDCIYPGGDNAQGDTYRLALAGEKRKSLSDVASEDVVGPPQKRRETSANTGNHYGNIAHGSQCLSTFAGHDCVGFQPSTTGPTPDLDGFLRGPFAEGDARNALLKNMGRFNAPASSSEKRFQPNNPFLSNADFDFNFNFDFDFPPTEGNQSFSSFSNAQSAATDNHSGYMAHPQGGTAMTTAAAPMTSAGPVFPIAASCPTSSTARTMSNSAPISCNAVCQSNGYCDKVYRDFYAPNTDLANNLQQLGHGSVVAQADVGRAASSAPALHGLGIYNGSSEALNGSCIPSPTDIHGLGASAQSSSHSSDPVYHNAISDSSSNSDTSLNSVHASTAPSSLDSYPPSGLEKEKLPSDASLQEASNMPMITSGFSNNSGCSDAISMDATNSEGQWPQNILDLSAAQYFVQDTAVENDVNVNSDDLDRPCSPRYTQTTNVLAEPGARDIASDHYTALGAANSGRFPAESNEEHSLFQDELDEFCGQPGSFFDYEMYTTSSSPNLR